ncbi:MAG: DUF4981 domain-containing protein [Treponema sp.]|nr:DUF4981 domain-containing protein [Treponema sp.]
MSGEGTQWLYGDDFAEVYDRKNGLKPRRAVGSNGCFCANGILAVDRSPHPAAREVKKCYQTLRVLPLRAAEGRYLLRNNAMFRDLSPYRLCWELAANGRVLEAGEVPPEEFAALGPQSEREISVISRAVPPQNAETTITFRWLLREASPWAEAGYQAAFDQIVLSPDYTPKAARTDSGTLNLSRLRNNIEIRGEQFCYRFEKGMVESIVWEGRELLVSPLRPNYYRPQTDNDRGYANFAPLLLPFMPCEQWKRAAAKARACAMRQTAGPHSASVTVRWKHPLLAQAETRYTVYGDGSLEIEHRAKAKRAMQRLGLTLALPPSFDTVEWYGRGPHENYSDRKSGAALGLYRMAVSALEHRYMRPQENAARCDLRFLALCEERGLCLDIEDLSGKGMAFSAWNYTAEALDAASHLHTLAKEKLVTLNIDGAMCGVGGDLPGIAALHRQYTLPAGEEHRLHIRLTLKQAENGQRG